MSWLKWILLGSVVCALWTTTARREAFATDVVSSRIDCTPRPIARIAPGTSVPNGPPRGWTHLIFKTRSTLATGDVKEVNELAGSLTPFLFTAMVARVRPVPDAQPPSYRLDKVAMGLGTRINRADRVLDGKTHEALGAELGMVQKMILSGAEQRLDKIVEIARSDTMAMVDAPTIMLIDGEHRETVFRYLFLVDPRNGRFDTLVWRVEEVRLGIYRLASGPAVWVQPNLVRICPLHVDGNKVFGSIPTSRAFAITRLPPGRPVVIPERLKSIAGGKRITPEAAGQLENSLRRMLLPHQPNREASRRTSQNGRR